MDPQKYGRITPDIPLIRGHTAPVVDLRISSLNPNILATGSDGIFKIKQHFFSAKINILF